MLVEKANFLAEYLNSNLAESYMSILNMMLNGRRVNNQDRGMFHRQTAKMAALVMSECYDRHNELLRKMGVKPTKALQELAQHIENRRDRDRKKASKRRRNGKKKLRLSKTGVPGDRGV
jgi:hypothetical protein